MKTHTFTAAILFILNSCSPSAPNDKTALEQRIKDLEAEVTSLRAQIAKPTAPSVQEFTGLYVASDSVPGIPIQIEFTAPGICQMHFPNGEAITATYEIKSGGILFDTKIGGVLFATNVGGLLQISQDGQNVKYRKR